MRIDPGSRDSAAKAIGADPASRLAALPNFGLLWEDMLGADVGADVDAAAGGGRLSPVAHLSLRDDDWALEEIARLGRDGIRLAMVAPAHDDNDRVITTLSDESRSKLLAGNIDFLLRT